MRQCVQLLRSVASLRDQPTRQAGRLYLANNGGRAAAALVGAEATATLTAAAFRCAGVSRRERRWYDARPAAAGGAAEAVTTTAITTAATSTKRPPVSKDPADIERRIAAIPLERFRNFCIVAHIDHGKSTLSDRLLELTGTISAADGNKQILDKLDVERERGITVKAQTCTMIYHYRGLDYLLHLVDTPGHVDFRAEVTRSYASCGGALLLVDASQGVQAQTVANFYHAFAQGLALVPVVNKVDLPSADVGRALRQLRDTFELDVDEQTGRGAVLVSAKTGQNVAALLPAVVERVPAPVGSAAAPLRLLLVDSWYDSFRGVVLLVRVFDGTVRAGDRLVSLATGRRYSVGEVGIQYPHGIAQPTLRAGQVGYLFFNPGMKKIQDAKIGDTFTTAGHEADVAPFPGFEEPKPMVFVAAFPTDPSDYARLADSISQLVLNDRSIALHKDFSEALGAGWRLGFLGSLHCSVFQDRLRQEHGASVIITEPAVPTKVRWRSRSNSSGGGATADAADASDSATTEQILTSAAEFPEADHLRSRTAEFFEPFVSATITVPAEYLGRVITLCESSRGEQQSIDFLSSGAASGGTGGAATATAATAATASIETASAAPSAPLESNASTPAASASPSPSTTRSANVQVIVKYALPAMSLVDDLFGKLKGVSRGYATLDYEDAGWRRSDLVKLQLLVNKKPVDAISRVMHVSQVDAVGRQWVSKFRQHVDRQMFEVIIQAAVGRRIVARETIKPFRKDVLAKLHAADISRRRKLLEKQKAGRKRLTAVGNVTIDHSAFQKFLSK